MRTYYIIVVSVLLVVFGLLFYPTLHLVVGNVDVSTVPTPTHIPFLPLTASAVTLLPYAFFGFVVYIIIKLSGR